MLNELKLGLFFGLIAPNPVAVMQMLAPQRAVVRADDVVVIDDTIFVVGTKPCRGLIPRWTSSHGLPSFRDCTVRMCEINRQYFVRRPEYLRKKLENSIAARGAGC